MERSAARTHAGKTFTESAQTAPANKDSLYELCTSDGFSGPIRHFRPLNTLQLTDSTSLKVIVVRAHAGEPPFLFSWLAISVYELCTSTDLTWIAIYGVVSGDYGPSLDSRLVEP